MWKFLPACFGVCGMKTKCRPEGCDCHMFFVVFASICALPVLWSSFKFALMSRETKTFLVIIFVALCVLSQNFAGKETLIAFSRFSTVRKLDRSVISQGLTRRFLVVNLLLISLFRSHNVTRMWFSLSISWTFGNFVYISYFVQLSRHALHWLNLRYIS